MEQRQYLCIDQKSFYATVECVERGLDPMKADLVVADPERSENTICLAVSSHLKTRGVKNRCRIKDIPSHMKVIVAPPRMRKKYEISEISIFRLLQPERKENVEPQPQRRRNRTYTKKNKEYWEKFEKKTE